VGVEKKKGEGVKDQEKEPHRAKVAAWDGEGPSICVGWGKKISKVKERNGVPRERKQKGQVKKREIG